MTNLKTVIGGIKTGVPRGSVRSAQFRLQFTPVYFADVKTTPSLESVICSLATAYIMQQKKKKQ